MFVMDLLPLVLHAEICPNLGMSRVCMHPKVARRLRNRLLRLDGQFDSALLACGRILAHHGLTQRTHLVRGVWLLVPVCLGV